MRRNEKKGLGGATLWLLTPCLSVVDTGKLHAHSVPLRCVVRVLAENGIQEYRVRGAINLWT